MQQFDPHLVANGITTFVASIGLFWMLALIVTAHQRVRYENAGWMTQVSVAIGLALAVVRVAMIKYAGI